MATALVEVQEARAEQVRENGRRSAHNILDELAETFEDVWRLRQRVRSQLDKEGEFDPVPLRLLCEAIAQARATCQVAVNIQHLAFEGERLRMEQEQAAASQETELRDIVEGALAGTLADDLAEAFGGMGVSASVARQAAVKAAPGLLARLISRFEETKR